jgi:hypothetical protein
MGYAIGSHRELGGDARAGYERRFRGNVGNVGNVENVGSSGNAGSAVRPAVLRLVREAAPEYAIDRDPAGGIDPTGAEADRLLELADEIVTLSAHIQAATARLLELVAEFDRLEGWRVDGHRTCAHWLAHHTGLDLGAAREKVRVARALEATAAGALDLRAWRSELRQGAGAHAGGDARERGRPALVRRGRVGGRGRAAGAELARARCPGRGGARARAAPEPAAHRGAGRRGHVHRARAAGPGGGRGAVSGTRGGGRRAVRAGPEEADRRAGG